METAAATAPVQGTETQTPSPNPPTQPQNQDPQVQKRLQHMARQEKAFRAQQAKFAQERDAFMAQQAEAQKQAEEFQKQQEWRSRISNGDYSALEEAGITKEQLTNYLINQPDPNMQTIAQMRAAISKLEAENAEIKSASEQAQQRNYEEAIFQYKNEAQRALKANPDQFQLVSAAGQDGIDAAVALVEHVYNTEKYVMSVDEALEDVERFYEDEAMKLAQHPKIMAKLTPAATVTKPTASKLAPGQVPFSQAVRQTMAQSAPTISREQMPSTMVPRKGTSESERRARAIAAFNDAK